MKNKYDIGDLLEEKVTGFQGIVMVIATYSTGCIHYGLCSRQKTNLESEIKETNWLWFDESRLKLKETNPLDFGISVAIEVLSKSEPVSTSETGQEAINTTSGPCQTAYGNQHP